MNPHALTDLPPGMLGQLRHSLNAESTQTIGGLLPGERSFVLAVALVAACAAFVLALHA
jgi:hypothetical protein